MINLKELLEDVKRSPYTIIEITAPHTGTVEFKVDGPGAAVHGPSGSWKEKPGTLLAVLEREHNPKPIHAPSKGVVEALNEDVAGKFVEAGTPLATIRHYLTSDEVVDLILKKTLHLFHAPERAKYYFVPEVDKKVKSGGGRSVQVQPGQELLIMSRMKRETPVAYQGPEGYIYAVYFRHDENVDAGAPLIGVCPGDQLAVVKEVVSKVRSDWEEPA